MSGRKVNPDDNTDDGVGSESAVEPIRFNNDGEEVSGDAVEDAAYEADNASSIVKADHKDSITSLHGITDLATKVSMKPNRWVLLPENSFVGRWDGIMSVMLLFTATVTPYEVGLSTAAACFFSHINT